MSIYPAPTNQQGSIFNPSLWVVSIVNGVTTEYLNANYLQYPVAQGNINLSGMTNIGTTTLDDILDANSNININGVDGVNYLQFPDGSKQFSAGGSGGNVITTSNNTFLSPATTQTFNAQNVVISGGLLSLTNGTTIPISGDGGDTNLYFPTSFPTGSTGNNAGLGFYWNKSGGGGETDLICYAQGAGGGVNPAGGLQIWSVNSSPNLPQLIASFFYGGISFTPNITSSNTYSGNNLYSGNNTYSAMNTFTQGYVNIADLTAPTISPSGYSQYISLNGDPYFSTNGGGANQLVLQNDLLNYAPLDSPVLTGNPSAPTPTSGDSSTNIATTAFVSNAISGISGYVQLNTNNTFTASNSFSLGYINIKNLTSFLQPSSPLGYSQYYSLNNLPFFQGSSQGSNTYQLATLANPAFSGTATAPTPTAGDSSTLIATTAFVSTAIANNNPSTFTFTSSAPYTGGVGTTWTFTFNRSVNFGNSCSFVLYTDTTPTTVVYPGTGSSTTQLNNSYGVATGNAVLQPITNGTNANLYLFGINSNVGTNLNFNSQSSGQTCSYTGTTYGVTVASSISSLTFSLKMIITKMT